MTLQVRGEAHAEAIRAAGWYERQARLGNAFRFGFRATLRRVEEHPLLYAVVHRDLRRAPIHRFPYGVYYTYDQRLDAVAVLAVVHDVRETDVWKHRRCT